VIKVGVVGYGTIGKRVADTTLLQDDMELVGIAGNTFNYRIKSAINKGINIFSADHLGTDLKRNGVCLSGKITDLLEECDIVCDCTPKGVGKKNKRKYTEHKVKAVFQGGEKPEIGASFVAQCNYGEVFGEDYIRVVSCNTTGLCRTLHAVHEEYGIDNVHATMIRRAADPWDIYHGPINAIVPALELPSHHGPDVRTVLPDFTVFTTSVHVPTTIMHMHSLTVDLRNPATAEDVLDLLENTTRVRVVKNSDGIRSTAEIIEYAKDIGRSRGDMPEVCVWDEGVGVWGNKLFYLQAVHQESDVVPETIDAIRSSMRHCGQEDSIKKTNESMGIN
jgi:glyceraldehyde-3-phosphate dehydrogenase (NAD(P))|tara:strand:- start:855 stop:1856 length:1002 start_codon:yes stop_codon:yes gene_type:complete